jgi:uncharacterized membrane protein
MIVPPALDSLAPLTSQRVRLPKHGKYTIKNEGVFTVVSRTAPLPLNNAIYALCYRWARAYTRWIPLLLRFVRMAASLNPGRFAIYFLGRVLSSLMDTASLWSDTRLEALVSFSTFPRSSPILAPYCERRGLAVTMELSELLLMLFHSYFWAAHRSNKLSESE